MEKNSKKNSIIKNYQILFTPHSELRLQQRQIKKEDVINHLRNPVSLKLAEKLNSTDEEKYKLWFIPYKRTAYIYVIVIKYFEQKIIVKTVIKQKLIWRLN